MRTAQTFRFEDYVCRHKLQSGTRACNGVLRINDWILCPLIGASCIRQVSARSPPFQEFVFSLLVSGPCWPTSHTPSRSRGSFRSTSRKPPYNRADASWPGSFFDDDPCRREPLPSPPPDFRSFSI